MGYISAEEVLKLAEPMKNSTYGDYLIAQVNGSS